MRESDPVEPSPLAHAAAVAEHSALARYPFPGTLLHEAEGATGFTIRAKEPEKLAFDGVQRAAATTLRRRVFQPETLRWVLAFVLEHREEFLAYVRRVSGRAS